MDYIFADCFNCTSFYLLCAILQIDLLPTEVRQIYKTYDTNGDDSLNYSEFLELLDSGKPKSTMRLDADTEIIVKSIILSCMILVISNKA